MGNNAPIAEVPPPPSSDDDARLLPLPCDEPVRWSTIKRGLPQLAVAKSIEELCIALDAINDVRRCRFLGQDFAIEECYSGSAILYLLSAIGSHDVAGVEVR
jgi:hypothetical protein